MTFQSRLRRTVSFVLALGLALLLLTLLYRGIASASEADEVYAADVVIDLADGRVIVRHITFTAPITGVTALQLADLDIVTAEFGWGTAVCAIEGVGCPADDCFCGGSTFWNYEHWEGGAWQSAPVGAGSYVVTDGSVEGHAWGEWGTAPPPVTPEILAAYAGLGWLRPLQEANGSFNNDVNSTVETIVSVASVGDDVREWQVGGNSLLDFVRAEASQYISGNVARTGKLAVGLAAADLDPRDFAGLDLIDLLSGTYNPETGAFGASLTDQTWGMLGWRAAGEVIPVTATRNLAGLADPDDGGWGFPGWGSDVDMTALALEALVAGGEPLTSSTILSGLAYLEAHQDPDGGFAPDWLGESNTSSTAWAVQGLLAAGEDPVGAGWTTAVSDSHPITYLLGMQLEDGGFAWVDPAAGADMLSTQQAIPALAGRPFPLPSRSVALRKAIDWTSAQQQADGSFGGAGSTIDAILAIAAAGGAPQRFVSTGGHTPLDYLATQVPTYPLSSAAAAGKLALGVAAAGGDPGDFAGLNLVVSMTTYYNPATGAFGTSTWDQALCMLGWSAAGEQVPLTATNYLTNVVNPLDGGWGYDPYGGAFGSDPDSTGLALQALAAAGVGHDNATVQGGLAYLRAVQNDDGGFPGFFGTTSPNSTGLALQGLAAYGEYPRSLRWTKVMTDGSSSRLMQHNPMDALLALQTAEGGFPGFSGPNDPMATYQAIPGIAGRAFPLHRFGVYLPLIARGS